MTIETLTVDRAHCTLDLLLYRRLKREVPGLVEDTLVRNQGLAALGPFLPIGTKVTFLVPAPAPWGAARAPVTLIRLTD